MFDDILDDMSDDKQEISSEAHNLMRLIDDLTLQMVEKINKNELDDVSELLKQRLSHLTQLVSLYSTKKSSADISALHNYLIDFQQRDQVIMQAVRKEYDVVKNTLANLDNLKKYVSV